MATEVARGVLRGCLLAASLFVSGIAAAQPSGLPPGVRGPGAGTATRSVSHYLDLERGLESAIADRDLAAAKNLIADDFEVWSPGAADAVPGDEWLRQRWKAAGHGRVRDLSVREFDDVAVASFLLEGARGVSGMATTMFVVDIWRQSSGKLLVRYVALPAHPPARSRRPSGRE